jgi:hypothetical protein
VHPHGDRGRQRLVHRTRAGERGALAHLTVPPM